TRIVPNRCWRSNASWPWRWGWVPTGYVGGWARWICFTITVLPHAGVINPASVLCAGFEPTASSIGYTIVVLSATIIVSTVLFRITLCLSLSLRESKHRANQRGRYKGTCDQGAQSKTIKSLHVDFILSVHRCTVPNLARGYARFLAADLLTRFYRNRTSRGFSPRNTLITRNREGRSYAAPYSSRYGFDFAHHRFSRD